MDDAQSISEIVKTYDLPLPVTDRIIRIATRRIRELSLASFKEKYRYVDELVGKFSEFDRYHLLPLDAKLNTDSDTSFAEMFGRDDVNLKNLCSQ